MHRKFAKPGQVRYKSDSYLGERLEMSFWRMNQADYSADQVFQDISYEWPGDKEGRTLLALTTLARATGETPCNLDGVVKRYKEKFSTNSYFGRLPQYGCADEQQLSGHSWTLRGLIEAYELLGEAWALEAALHIVEALLYPCRGLYDRYPKEPNVRSQGNACGNLTGRLVEQWYTSTDIGCAYIMMDGASRVYEYHGDCRLADLLDEMVASFSGIPLVEISMQTHATLSACRGLLRYYSVTSDRGILNKVSRIFDEYLAFGSTESWANMNWFGKPTWTEPCAVVDSFMIAMSLWQATGLSKYLDYASSILWNGLLHGQRLNGGFGCDSCAVPGNMKIHAISGIYEAHWCCTMRGAEGLARLPEFSYSIDQDTVYITYPTASTAVLGDDESFRISQYTAYPSEGVVNISINRVFNSKYRKLAFFVPSWVDLETLVISSNNIDIGAIREDRWIVIDITKWDRADIQISFDIRLRRENPRLTGHLQDAYTLWHGPCLLGSVKPVEPFLPELPHLLPSYQTIQKGLDYSCICDRTFMTARDSELIPSIL